MADDGRRSLTFRVFWRGFSLLRLRLNHESTRKGTKQIKKNVGEPFYNVVESFHNVVEPFYNVVESFHNVVESFHKEQIEVRAAFLQKNAVVGNFSDAKPAFIAP